MEARLHRANARAGSLRDLLGAEVEVEMQHDSYALIRREFVDRAGERMAFCHGIDAVGVGTVGNGAATTKRVGQRH
jgi:hypothetical protein